MTPISQVTGSSPPALSTAPRPGAAEAGDVPFSDLISGMLSDVNQQQHQVGAELTRLTSGESDHIHDLVMSVTRADMALRLVIEIRDQLISSYQEVMRMQM